jgi:molecular chaperone GrpE
MNQSDFMPRTNGKSEVEPRDLDSEHELPSGDETQEDASPVASVPAQAGESSELQKLRAERDNLLYRLADLENARKRAARDQQEFRDYALVDAIRVLLPILDSFERALHVSQNEKSELRSGVELIYRQFQDALGKLGVKPVPAKGELFDPRVHEAIETVETTQAEDHRILEELQRGYKLKERLLRPAMVKIARNVKR